MKSITPTSKQPNKFIALFLGSKKDKHDAARHATNQIKIDIDDLTKEILLFLLGVVDFDGFYKGAKKL